MNATEMKWTVNLQTVRKIAGMSRKAMAEQAGISWRQLAAYELGENQWSNMSAEMLHKLEDYLGCSLLDLTEVDFNRMEMGMACGASAQKPTVPAIISTCRMMSVADVVGLDYNDAVFKRVWNMIPEAAAKRLPVSVLGTMVRQWI